jgi:hypothetical protein
MVSTGIPVSTRLPLGCDPTATQFVELVHDSPARLPFGLGFASLVQDAPSHVSMEAPPTATQSVALAQLMAVTVPGLETADQVVPFRA